MIFTPLGQARLRKVIQKTLVSCGISTKDEASNHAELILQAIEKEMLKLAHKSGKKGSPHEPPEPPEGGGVDERAFG